MKIGERGIDNQMSDSFQPVEAMDKSKARFVTAQNNSRTITEQDRLDVDLLTQKVIELGAYIEALCPDGRNKSLSLTHLEDVLTRANKAIYVDRK